MQCTLTHSDYELYYGGETLANVDRPQSFTCPYCSKMGHTEAKLLEHVTTDHADTICPICASVPGSVPNLRTDFTDHLTLGHQSSPHEVIPFFDQSNRPNRLPMRIRFFSNLGSRDVADPIAELVSQLSGVRRSANNVVARYQQVQTQLQQVETIRQPLERLLRRQAAIKEIVMDNSQESRLSMLKHVEEVVQPATYLLDGILDESVVDDVSDEFRADRAEFVLQLLLSTLTNDDGDNDNKMKLF